MHLPLIVTQNQLSIQPNLCFIELIYIVVLECLYMFGLDGIKIAYIGWPQRMLSYIYVEIYLYKMYLKLKFCIWMTTRITQVFTVLWV